MKAFFDTSVLVPVFYGEHTHHRVSLAGRIDDYEMAFLAQLVEHTVAKFLPQFSVTKGLNINFVDL